MASANSVEDVLQRLGHLISAASKAIQEIRERDRDQSHRLTDLAKEHTDAFVELSEHYLPELSHKEVSGAWAEVRRDVRDVLLRKDDERRRVREQIGQSVADEEAVLQRLSAAREAMKEAATVLACKEGNVRKILREDPDIVHCNEQIARLDSDIEHCLGHLEQAEAESNRKLPNYEKSHLFSYLRDRNYGSSEYQERGLERRWDRWVAKLINYEKAKDSYDFLVEMPQQLKSLIDEKQNRYRNLLVQLKQARKAAIKQHGVKKQVEVWKTHVREVESIEEELAEARWKTVEREGRLCELETLHGPYYDEALQIYQRFLTTLEPDLLRVYAECTDSPVDDQICARIRDISTRIDEEKRDAKDRFIQILKHEKAISVSRDLINRLHRHCAQTPGEVDFSIEFNLDDLINQIHEQKMTPDGAWRVMRESLLRAPEVEDIPFAELIEDGESRSHVQESANEEIESMSVMDAVLMATSEFSRKTSASDRVDLSGIILMQPSNAADVMDYQCLAICNSKAEAKYVVEVLNKELIPAFRHTHDFDPDHPQRSPPVDVVVSSDDFDLAKKLLIEERQREEEPWQCDCSRIVGIGFRVCSYCGRTRP